MPKNTFTNLPDEKKQYIIDTCYDLFINIPYEKITIRDIVKETGISIGSFYKYFEDKEDLYLYLMLNIEKKYTAKQREFYGPHFLMQEPLKIENAYTPKEVAFNRTWYKVPVEVHQHFYFGPYADEMNCHLMEEIQQLQGEGVIRADIDLDFFYFMYSTTLFNMQMYFRNNGIEDDHEKLKIKNAFLRDIFLNGVLTHRHFPKY